MLTSPRLAAARAKWLPTSGAATFLFLVIGGCVAERKEAIPPDVLQAACMSQAFLHKNGFLRVTPMNEKGITFFNADERYVENGKMNYARLFKDRSNQFTRKLAGVWTTSEAIKYLVLYRPINRAQACLGINEKFESVYMPYSCKSDGVFVALRERDLRCTR